MAIFKCSQCGYTKRVKDEYAGRKARCSKCPGVGLIVAEPVKQVSACSTDATSTQPSIWDEAVSQAIENRGAPAPTAPVAFTPSPAKVARHSPPRISRKTEESQVYFQHEGIGRIAFFALYIGMVAVQAGVEAAFKDSAPVRGGTTLLMIVVALVLVAMRCKNIGMSGWWALALFVPILNWLLIVRCLAYPAGYQHHKQFDLAAKIIIGLGLAALLVGLAFFARVLFV